MDWLAANQWKQVHAIQQAECLRQAPALTLLGTIPSPNMNAKARE